MNTPPQPKAPIRFGSQPLVAQLPPGSIFAGIRNDTIALNLGGIAGRWPHAEEAMIRLLAVILGSDGDMAAHQIFRSIINQKARIDVMRNLLENTPQAVGLDAEADRFISEFAALNGCRNSYLHGIWMTDIDTNKVYLAEADTTHFAYLPSRRVTEKELKQIHLRIEQLELDLHRYVNDLRERRAWQHQRERDEERRRTSRRIIP